MRFKEFLLKEDEGVTMTLEQGLEYIKERCIPYLQQIHGTHNWMYRGMRMPVNKVIHMDHIKERQPRDSAPAFNVFFNTGMELAQGIDMIRSSALFCVGDISVTGEYGNPYFVFPQGHFKYIWSQEITDSYVQEDRMYASFLRKLSDISSEDTAIVAQGKDAFNKVLNASGGNIRRAVTNMKTNDELVEEAFQESGIKATVEEIDRALTIVFDDLYIPNDSLDTALGRGGEVLIYESDGCFFVPVGLVMAHIRADENLEGQSPEEFLTNYFWGA